MLYLSVIHPLGSFPDSPLELLLVGLISVEPRMQVHMPLLSPPSYQSLGIGPHDSIALCIQTGQVLGVLALVGASMASLPLGIPWMNKSSPPGS